MTAYVTTTTDTTAALCVTTNVTTYVTTDVKCYATDDGMCSTHNILLEKRKYWGETNVGTRRYRLVDSLFRKLNFL